MMENPSQDVEDPKRKRHTCCSNKVFLFTAVSAISIITLMTYFLVQSIESNKALTSKLSLVRKKMFEFEHTLFSANFSFPRTCEGYKGRNETLVINPSQGFSQDSQIHVHCRNGSTIIGHDNPERAVITDLDYSNGHYILDLNYNANLADIKQLMEVSEECYQDISYSHTWTFLTASWTDFNGKQHNEFGRITSFEILPLKHFQCENFGHGWDLGSIHVGPLICKGTRGENYTLAF